MTESPFEKQIEKRPTEASISALDTEPSPLRIYRVNYRNTYEDGTTDPAPKPGAGANPLEQPRAICVVATCLLAAIDLCELDASDGGPIVGTIANGKVVTGFDIEGVGQVSAPPAYIAD